MLGVKHFLEQLNVNVKLVHYLDASAAKGVLMRKGSGKVKHLEVRQLWGQHMVERYKVDVRKIPRKQDLADNFTHAIGRQGMELFYESVGLC